MTDYLPGSLYEKAFNIGFEQGFKQGFKQGFEKGKKLGKLLVSVKFILRASIGMPKLTIRNLSKITDIPIKTVKSLLLSFKEDSLAEIHEKLKKTLFSQFSLPKQEKKEMDTLLKAFKNQENLSKLVEKNR